MRHDKQDYFSLTGPGEIENVRVSPSISLRINPNFIHYLYENHIVFGKNLVIRLGQSLDGFLELQLIDQQGL